MRGVQYARVRLGGGKRAQAKLVACKTEEEADERAGIIAEVAQDLLDAGRAGEVQEFADLLGAAATPSDVEDIRAAVAKRIGLSAPIAEGITFAQLAERWTSGELAREYPDHVAAVDHRKNVSFLGKHVLPLLGPIPVSRITLNDCDRVMSACAAPAGSSLRRHVAQIMHRLMTIAAYPARVIALSPIPKGWLPKLGPQKAKGYLYPDEDRKLLRCKDVPLDERLLFGFLAREGCRASEAIAAQWSDFELRRGSLNLDENKSDDPRAWALDPGVVRTLRWLKAFRPKSEGPFCHLTGRHLAERLRDALHAAKVKREALFENTDRRRHIVAHDLRGTFVTLSLANGKTETWVADRTGHASTLMIARYRRTARTAAELGLGPLGALDRTIPECMGGAQVGHKKTRHAGKKDAK